MSLETDAPLVGVCGANASGKTSLLEAVYLLLYGASFRTRQGGQLISFEAEDAIVRATIGSDSGGLHHVATQRQRRADSIYRLDGEGVRPVDLVRRYPVQIIDSSVFDLIEGGPSCRRRFVDWGMFHVEQEFFSVWKKHRRLLRQWGALLRKRASASEFAPWIDDFCGASDQLSVMRRDHVAGLAAKLREAVGGAVSLEYAQGWPEDMDYKSYLNRSLAVVSPDLRLKAGPHLFDVRVRTAEGYLAKDVLSRGQKKLLGLRLKLAQIRLYNAQVAEANRCIVLVDDLAAEVDDDNQAAAIKELVGAGSQVFVTGIDPAQLEKLVTLSGAKDRKMFHVKQGEIEPLIEI